MKNKQKNKSFIYIILTLLLLVVTVLGGRGFSSAFADTARYTKVMDDLQLDETFNENDYSDDSSDYSVKVIQIAESVDGDLFIYTYQPCQKTRYVVATSVNMSLSESVTGTRLYDLELLSSSGVFCKYLVKDYNVSNKEIRYYNISTIYRPFDRHIDENADNENTKNEIAYAVGQLWTVKTVDGTVNYEMTATEVLKITSQMIGFRRYDDGFQWSGTKSCDAHFLLFNCDHKIDYLISADISFYTQSYKALAGSGAEYGSKVQQTAYLRYDDEVSNDGGGWFGKKERWQRMASTTEFMRDTQLTDEETEVFKKYDWVLNFYETEYACEAGGKDVLISALIPFGFIWTIVNACTTTGTIVSDVTLLRLEFNCNGEIYNLGVVGDKQTGSGKPTNSPADIGFWAYIWDCLKNFFTGNANFIESAVAITVIIVAVVLLVLAIKFIRFIVKAVAG